ncbi:hypothetical protein Cgig2_006346 [Carnegiea gigantea]|uniref:Kinesin motor domain-containing protein n=1 Tax=Carnegiea gigantea TaxID=171969 RepID=A0A9Q1JPN0_9CARY|nr:hypothetical protein Cgig2_006346 [Carnegiea gigantea]
MRISSLNDMYKRLQEYNTSLQQYNSKLQSELAAANETLKGVEREKAVIVEEISRLRGQYNSLQDQLASFKVVYEVKGCFFAYMDYTLVSRASQEETAKQKEALANEMGSLRTELQKARDDSDRQLLQVVVLMEEVAKYEDYTGRSASQLDCLTMKSTELEVKCSPRDELVRALQTSDLSATEMRNQFEEQNILICDLQNRLADAEQRLIEGEKLRKKLHNAILELKGNIRVFCRVRPLLPDEGSNGDSKSKDKNTPYMFDKVFMPDASQEDVFLEVSQLVQSALDGYKVCIFAYGRTGSGKTFTMMGSPGNSENNGLVPRSLEQIFETRQSLQSQGWKYELQVSMLEIYNETIYDLLSTNKSSSTENNSSGKQYTIKHDAQGNTHVSDLTIVDVRSSKEVSYLLEKAAQSR